MKLGIGTYSYMWSIGFEGARPSAPLTAMGLLDKAKELNVKVVQYGPNLDLETLEPAERAELVTAAREAGIELELGTRGVQPDHLRRMLALTKECGAKFLRSVPELEGGRIPDRQTLANCLAEIEPDFAQAGVTLGLENSLIPACDLAWAVADAGSPWLGVTLDTVNSLAIPEGAREVVRELAPLTVCLHLKDFVVKREWHMMGFRVEGCPAGKGRLDVPWLLKRLREAGARGNAILELWPPLQSSVDQTAALEQRWAAESIQTLREWIKE